MKNVFPEYSLHISTLNYEQALSEGYNKWLMAEKLSSTALMEVLARISVIRDRGSRNFRVKMSFCKYFQAVQIVGKQFSSEIPQRTAATSRLFACLRTAFDRSFEASRVKMLHRLCTQAVWVHANVKLAISLVCHAIFPTRYTMSGLERAINCKTKNQHNLNFFKKDLNWTFSIKMFW